MTSETFLQVLRDSAPYIHAHHGRTFVIAFGGEAAARADFSRLIYDVGMETVALGPGDIEQAH